MFRQAGKANVGAYMAKLFRAFLVGLLVALLMANLVVVEQVALAEQTPPGEALGNIRQVNGVPLASLSNGAITRVIKLGQNGPVTTSLLNRISGAEYLQKTTNEFRLVLSHELAGIDETAELPASAFRIVSYRWNVQTRALQQLQVELSGTFMGYPLRLTLYYEMQADSDFTRKWLKVAPFVASGWVIREAIIEDWQATTKLQPLTQVQRYPELHADSSDEVNYSTGVDLAQVSTAYPNLRFATSNYSRQVALHSDGSQGIYFFTASLFGNERFESNGNLRLGNEDFVEPGNGFTSGQAVTGVWKGAPEIGFKRYNDYLYHHYAIVKDKKDPIWFSSWYVYEDKINAANLDESIDNMQAAGFYDVLHIDAGWEADAPLQVATTDDKFPGGLEPLMDKLKAAGLGLGLWMNPFSGRYESITSYQSFREQHPEWVASNGVWICPLSGAGQYIHQRLLEIARNWPLQELYWDGADWNLAGCDSADKGWRTPAEEHVLRIKFFANLLQELHAIRPDLRVVVWSAPGDVHWLSVADQLQLSDIDTPPLGPSELIRRQQIYHASFLRPASAIWGDWYGLQYRRTWDESLGLPMNQLQYAEISQLGNGATQAGGSYALPYAPPELTEFVARMFAFRKRFASYFNTYQHILGFPDGQNIDGEAHVVNGKGFILLYNPSQAEQTINLPLYEPELELKAGQTYNLSDWSSFDTSTELGKAQPNETVPVTVPPLGWRIIGLNLPVTGGN